MTLNPSYDGRPVEDTKPDSCGNLGILFKFCARRNVGRMLNPINQRDVALKYHRLMREEIRRYLNGRGIPDAIIKRQLLGWNGSRITIPIFGRDGEVLFFRF